MRFGLEELEAEDKELKLIKIHKDLIVEMHPDIPRNKKETIWRCSLIMKYTETKICPHLDSKYSWKQLERIYNYDCPETLRAYTMTKLARLD